MPPCESDAGGAQQRRREIHPHKTGQVDDEPVKKRAHAIAQGKRHGKTRHGAAPSFYRRTFHGEGKDLRAALDTVLANKPVPSDQKPSIGCNIKWKSGNAPDYFS